MKYLNVVLLSLTLLLFSCSSDNVTNTNVTTSFDIPITQYTEKAYLLDEYYNIYYEDYFLGGLSDITITKIEVWVYADSTNPQRREAIGYADIDAKPPAGYPDSIATDSAGYRIYGNFVKLNPSEYTLYQNAGFIILNNYTPVTSKDVILVSYTFDNSVNTYQYGDYLNEVPSSATLHLKLIRDKSQKSPRENVVYTKLWSLMLKNIYNIGVKNLPNDPNKYTNLKVVKRLPGNSPMEIYVGDPVHPNWGTGKNYMYHTGIDRCIGLDPDTSSRGDGFFDFFPGKTIDLANGYIIFPYMKPFSDEMLRLGINPDSLAANDSIYYQSKAITVNYPIYFYITGKIVVN